MICLHKVVRFPFTPVELVNRFPEYKLIAFVEEAAILGDRERADPAGSPL